jgi:hypothetical protein
MLCLKSSELDSSLVPCAFDDDPCKSSHLLGYQAEVTYETALKSLLDAGGW